MRTRSDAKSAPPPVPSSGAAKEAEPQRAAPEFSFPEASGSSAWDFTAFASFIRREGGSWCFRPSIEGTQAPRAPDQPTG